MKQYRVLVTFDRIDVAGTLVKGTSRSYEFGAASKTEAKKRALSMFRKNEPTRKKIHSAKVNELKDI